MITDESIEQVREAADILDIVGEHVKLRRAGADWRGPCPFHGGKNPNFSVSPRRNAYHCFKCGESGDAIRFVREHLGMDFVEAVRYVAARAGVEVRETRAPRDEQERDRREPLWEAMNAAAELFRAALWDDADAQPARDYLASRALGREEADRFGLGWAPRDGERVLERLRAQGHDDARLLDVGLLRRREESEAPYPYFRGRLMIPIADGSGRTVAFGGRVVGPGEPKYLNSPQTALFDKGRQLYGLTWARHAIRKAERVLVVEGYFDAIRLALAGIDEAVAPLGTALTETQAAMLAKLTRNVFLLYDSDDAGLKATFRAGHELLRLGVSPRVVTLPDGEDPDTFVRAHGAAGLERFLSQAVDLFDRQIQLLERKGWFAELHRKRRAIDRLLPTLRATADEMTRQLYVARLAEVSGVDAATIAREVAAPERGRPGARPLGREAGGRGDADGRPRPDGPEVAGDGASGGSAGADGGGGGVVFVEPRRDDRPYRRPWEPRRKGKFRKEDEWASSLAVPRIVSRSARVLRAERDLVRAMLQDRDVVESVAERWDLAALHHPQYREIAAALVDDPHVPLERLAESLPSETVRVVDELMALPEPDPRSVVESWLTRLQAWAIDEELARITAQLMPAGDGSAPDDAATTALTRRKQALVRERAALSPHFSRVGRLPEG